MIMLRLDDPLDTVAVHAGGGKQILSYFSRHTLLHVICKTGVVYTLNHMYNNLPCDRNPWSANGSIL